MSLTSELLLVRTLCTCVLTNQDHQKVYLRFGQLSCEEYVLDFREAAFSPMVALAVACAVLAEKTLCPL